MREESYRSAGDRVKAWADRRQAARDRCLQADEKHSKKMTEAFERKEVRTREWRVQMAEEARQKAEALAATRKAASGRFVDELKQRDAQLEEAQLRAERNRLRLEEAKMIDLEQRADRAEEKWREVWDALDRVEHEQEQRTAQLDAECKKKAQRAEECLERRRQAVQERLRDNVVWRIPGHVGARGLL